MIIHSDENGAEDAQSKESVRVVEVGTASPSSDTPSPREVKANLRWGKGTTIVVSGTVMSTIPTNLTVSLPFVTLVVMQALPYGHIKVSNIVLTLKESAWRIEILIQPTSTSEGTSRTPQWLASVEPVRFVPVRREHCDELM